MLAEARTWGDGGGKNRAHEIEVMSYELGVIFCGVDGTAVRFGEVPADVAWDQHRGVQVPYEQRVVDRSAQATDAEVDEFLRWVGGGGDGLPPTVGRSVAYAADHATGDLSGSEEVLTALLDTLREWQARCTCDTTDITQCPNYVDGDEEDIE